MNETETIDDGVRMKVAEVCRGLRPPNLHQRTGLARKQIRLMGRKGNKRTNGNRKSTDVQRPAPSTQPTTLSGPRRFSIASCTSEFRLDVGIDPISRPALSDFARPAPYFARVRPIESETPAGGQMGRSCLFGTLQAQSWPVKRKEGMAGQTGLGRPPHALAAGRPVVHPDQARSGA